MSNHHLAVTACLLQPNNVVNLTAETLSGLLQACSEQERLQHLAPSACEAYLQPDNERPFSLKHSQQQASIVGHMQQSGLLQASCTMATDCMSVLWSTA